MQRDIVVLEVSLIWTSTIWRGMNGHVIAIVKNHINVQVNKL
jgi:hypothetical protein